MPLPFIRGFAERATAERGAVAEEERLRQRRAYESMLRGQERAPELGIARERVGLQREQVGIQREQVGIQRQQAARQQFESKANLWLSTIDPKDGEFFEGMEAIGMQAEADLYGTLSPMFRKDGALEKTEGKTPQETLTFKAIRDFVKNPTAENRKKIKVTSGITPPTRIQPLARGWQERIGGRGAEYAEAVRTYGAEKASQIISQLRTLVQQGTPIQQLRTWLEEAGLNADLFLKFYE